MMHDDSRESVADWDGQPMGEHWTHQAGVREIVAKAMADAWDEGYRSGLSNAMRRMSDALQDAADDLALLVDSQHPDAVNPDQWLRERADRIGGGE